MAEVDPGPDPEAVIDDSIKPIADDSKGCLHASMKIGNLVFNVYLDETGLSWVKRGKPKDKAGKSHLKNKMKEHKTKVLHMRISIRPSHEKICHI